MLRSSTALIEQRDIVAAARALIGTPFRHQGKDPEFGLDCRGLVLCVGYQIGYQFSGREWATDYQVHPDPESEAFARKAGELLEALETEFVRIIPINSAALVSSTIVHIQLPDQPLPTHCGILADNQHELTIIHAVGRDYGGEVIEEPLRRWLPYVAGAFAWKGVV
jgi:cell wall-associated NlpC family hydrolase